jgi:hypothetical protein
MSGPNIEEWEEGISFDILVAPRASRERLGPVVGDRVKVSVTAPPVEGEANAAVVALLARALGVRRQDVEIVTGTRGRRKRVRVRGAGPAVLLGLLPGGQAAEERDGQGR